MKIFLGYATLALAAAQAWAQFIGGGLSQPKPRNGEAVEYLYPEQVTVAVGKPSQVSLHFRIAPGLHINSHAPLDEFLIPTAFSIPSGKGVKLTHVDYPKGIDITLPANPKEKLSVYTNDFILDAQIVAEPGNHLVEAKLRFQACDQRECMPPKTIPVTIDIIGK